MSFSLYGALPPSKSGKETDKKENTTSTGSGGIGGLYSSLPAPESGPTSFKKSEPSSSSTTTTPPTSTDHSTTTSINENTAPPAPAGWSAFNKFRPVLRRPTIQAKPKLNKTFIPTGATIVSEKKITKEEKELDQAKAQALLKEEEDRQRKDNIDLGVLPLLTSAEDVNGFRAVQKSKKKGKKGKMAANAPPQPAPLNMLEDYDPHRPNDYEQYKEERRELREKQKRKRDWEKRQDASVGSPSWSRSQSRSRSRSRSRSYSRSRSRSPYRKSRSPTPEYNRPNIPPPVKINVNETAEDAYMRRLRMSQQQQQQPQPQIEQPRQEETHPAHDIARKLLAKYGWQEGQGLGRDEEGMKEPLQVQAYGHGVGAIVNNNQESHVPQPEPPRIEKPVIRTKVILLTNMVGPGEVDDMLQEETADECSKYGKVERCLIFEVPRGKIADDRAVRIFVKFSNIESAEKAINDLNGRFFGGRVVHASYFDTIRFEKLDLAPSKEEYYI